MPHSIVMPALEMAQESGRLLAWRKQEGDSVKQGEPLLDIETDKAVVEIEAPASGILSGLKARDGDVIPVGQTIGWILLPGENIPADTQSAATSARSDSQQIAPQPSLTGAASASSMPSSHGIKISPKARRLAREHGIDLTRVRGSGNEGEILAEDVMKLVGPSGRPVGLPASATGLAISSVPEAMSSIARLMAERTTASWTTVPHFFMVREIDAGGLLEAREKAASSQDAGKEARITVTDILVSLVARVLPQHPRLYASWLNNGINIHKDINIGIAAAVDEGVVTIVIPNANNKTLVEIAALRAEMAQRARAGRPRPADLIGATFTVSNLGMYNVDAFTAIIPAPQAAILAVGRIADRVVPVDGNAGVRPMMTVTLSCDHRVVDGARAAKFLNDFADAAAQDAKPAYS